MRRVTLARKPDGQDLDMGTPFDFFSVIPGLSSVSYVADPQRWYFLLQIPGLWRAMFLVNEDASDERVQTREFAQSLMATVVPGLSNYEISHITLYKVHQRVAKTFRLGRTFLVGDAAHINNPLGGMGMNFGIHDAVELTGLLGQVIRREAKPDVLDLYDRHRRPLNIEFVQQQTIANKKRMEEKDPAAREKEFDQLRRTAADPAAHRAYVRRASLVESVRKRATATA